MLCWHSRMINSDRRTPGIGICHGKCRNCRRTVSGHKRLHGRCNDSHRHNWPSFRPNHCILHVGRTLWTPRFQTIVLMMRWLNRCNSVLFQVPAGRGPLRRLGRFDGRRKQVRLECRRVAHFDLARMDLVGGLVVITLTTIHLVCLGHLAEVIRRVHLVCLLAAVVGRVHLCLLAAVVRGGGFGLAAVWGGDVLLHEVLEDAHLFFIVAVVPCQGHVTDVGGVSL